MTDLTNIIQSNLNNLFPDEKINLVTSKQSIIAYTTGKRQNRKQKMQKLADCLSQKYNFTCCWNNGGKSSAGQLLIDNKYRLYLKPFIKMDSLNNEKNLQQIINTFCSDIGVGLNIAFYDEKRKRTKKYTNITQAKLTGNLNQPGKRQDILLLSNNKTSFPISIKMPNFQHVESSDRSLKFLSECILDKLESGVIPHITFRRNPKSTLKNYHFENVTDVFVAATPFIMEWAYFGQDILKDNGSVVVRKFTENDFEFMIDPASESGLALKINVDYLFNTLSDVADILKFNAFIQINEMGSGKNKEENRDAKRVRITPKYRGLRSQIVTASRINRQSTVLFLEELGISEQQANALVQKSLDKYYTNGD